MKNRICGVHAGVLVLDKPFQNFQLILLQGRIHQIEYAMEAVKQVRNKLLYFYKRFLAHQVAILLSALVNGEK